MPFCSLLLLHNHLISFSFLLVTLVHPVDNKDVANGTVILREIVHCHPVGPDEVAIIIHNISDHDEIQYPKHEYLLKQDGSNTWNVNSLRQWIAMLRNYLLLLSACCNFLINNQSWVRYNNFTIDNVMFGVVQPYQTCLNHRALEGASIIRQFLMSLGWFNPTEPASTTKLLRQESIYIYIFVEPFLSVRKLLLRRECDRRETRDYYGAPHGGCRKGVDRRWDAASEESAARFPCWTNKDAMFFVGLRTANTRFWKIVMLQKARMRRLRYLASSTAVVAA